MLSIAHFSKQNVLSNTRIQNYNLFWKPDWLLRWNFWDFSFLYQKVLVHGVFVFLTWKMCILQTQALRYDKVKKLENKIMNQNKLSRGLPYQGFTFVRVWNLICLEKHKSMPKTNWWCLMSFNKLRGHVWSRECKSKIL